MCKQKKDIHKDITEIQIDFEKSNRVDILQIVEDIHLIPLETKDECLIDNVEMLKTDGNNFYIWNYNNPVKMFSKEGMFVAEISHKGVGPGEFIQINDILINRDTISIFAWNGNRKWIRYSCNNQFLYETDMTFPFYQICQIDENKYLAYVLNSTVSSESAYNLYCIDENFNVLSRLDPKNPPTDIPFSDTQNHFFQNAEHTFYIKEYCDTIYTISNNLDIRPKYHLNFGKNWCSRNFLEKYHDQNFIVIHDAINQNKYARFVNFYENDRHVLVNYYLHRNKGKQHEYDNYLAVYCKYTGNILDFKSSSENNIWVDLVAYPCCVDENQFIGLITADKLLNLASKIDGNDTFSRKIKACAKQINEMDNPILVRFSFKSLSDI
jgi:hypothetical protein